MPPNEKTDETELDAVAEGEQFDPIAMPALDEQPGTLRLGTPKAGRRLAKPGKADPPDGGAADPDPRHLGSAAVCRRETSRRWSDSRSTRCTRGKQMFEEQGPAGLMSKPRGRSGSRMPELTKRAILMLKEASPELGCQRISDMLARGPALGASPSAVARVLKEAGYELEEVPTRPHPDHPRRFERAKPNQLWQTDLFTFVLKRQNRRVYLVGFMDDHSRFIVGYGLHASQSTALVLEALRSSITNYGVPQEILTDNGTQYVTWRGQSQFSKELAKQGIAHVVAKPRRPQTLGKIERFWGTLWRECVEAAVFRDLDDARQRIGHYVDHYNFHRPHQGLEGLVPADRFFEAAPQVLATQKQRIADNALELARHGVPKQPLYLTGQAGGRSFTVHSEGERVFLTREGEPRQEVDLSAPAEPTPGTSPLDEALTELHAELASKEPQ